MLKDRNIDYRYATKTVLASEFAGKQFVAATPVIGQMHDNTVVLEELDDHLLNAWNFSNNSAGKYARDIIFDTTGIDWSNTVYLRALWCTERNGAVVDETLVFKFNLELLNLQVDGIDNLNGYSVVTAEADAPSATEGDIMATAWAPLAAETLAPTVNDCIVVDVELDDVGTFATDGSEDIGLVGYQIAYLPKFTDGAQNNHATAPADE